MKITVEDHDAVLFRDVAGAWLAHQQERVAAGALSPVSVKQYARWLSYILPVLGPKLIERVNREAIEKYLHGRVAAGLCHRSANNELKAIRAILNWAYDCRMIDAVPRVKSLPDPAVDKELPDAGAVAAFLKTLPPHLYYPLEFARITGLSWAELVRLQWRDVDIEGEVVRIGMRPDFPVKTAARRRKIPLSKPAVMILHEVHELRRVEPDDTDRVFRNAVNVAKELRGYRSRRSAVQAAITPSLMRKVFASTAAEMGVPEHHLQYLMGHSPGSTITRRHYIRVNREKALASGTRVATALAGS